MKKELLVTGAGRESTITIDRAADGAWVVEVDGTPRAVDARQVRPGTWSLMVDGQSYLVDLDPRKKGVAASVGASEPPAEVMITVEDAQTRRLRQSLSHGATSARGEDVRAPIAGKVVKMLVAIGDEVAAHQPVAVLEAMKMENEIIAERGGKVSEIKKEAGQSVETGELLMVLT
jgi:biotin carboxyl carrier protein